MEQIESEAFLELRTEAEWRSAYPVFKDFRPKLREEQFLANRETLLANNYRLLALRRDEQVVCIAGVAIEPHIQRVKELWVNDLATLETERSKGLGEKMLRFVEEFARQEECSRILLYTRQTNEHAIRFYEEKSPLMRYGVTFSKEL